LHKIGGDGYLYSIMTNPYLFLTCFFALAIRESIFDSSPEGLPYKETYLDTFFAEDLLNYKRNHKRKIDNVALNDLVSTFVKGDADNNNVDNEVDVGYGIPSLSPIQTKNVFKGFSSLAYFGKPTPSPLANEYTTDSALEENNYLADYSPSVAFPSKKPFTVFASKPIAAFHQPYQTQYQNYPPNSDGQFLNNPVNVVRSSNVGEKKVVDIKPFTYFNAPYQEQENFTPDIYPSDISYDEYDIAEPTEADNRNIFSVFLNPVIEAKEYNPVTVPQPQVVDTFSPIFSRLQIEPKNAKTDNKIFNPKPTTQEDFVPAQSDVYDPKPLLQPEVPNQTASSLSLFQTINLPAIDRDVRRRISGDRTGKDLSKSAALNQLMAIAGENWEEKLYMGDDQQDSQDSSGFVCPQDEGLFPSPSGSCDEYFQCAQGKAHRNKCTEGLAWNVATNQCDWKESVQCAFP